MTSRTKQLIITILLWIIVLCLVGSCADLLMRASLRDLTLLGDPYYQDTVLATQRAPIALILTWCAVAAAGIIGLLKWKRR